MLKSLVVNHLGFWLGIFAGGAGGYLFGATVKAGVLAELAAAKQWISDVQAGKVKV